MKHDLIIRGGVVVDGTGLGRRRADIAVSAGRITAVGHVPNASDAERVIDADGLIVSPGIVDLTLTTILNSPSIPGPRPRVITA